MVAGAAAGLLTGASFDNTGNRENSMLLKRLLAVFFVTTSKKTWELLFAVLWVICFLYLGYVGFQEYYKAAGVSASISDNFYNTIALFLWDFNTPLVDPETAKDLQVPEALHIARWGAPLLLAYAAAKTFLVLLQSEVNQLWMLTRSRHLVVIGLNNFSLSVIRQSRDKRSASTGLKVNLVVQDANNPLLADIRNQPGLRVLVSPSLGVDVLSKASAYRAKQCLVCSDDDETNVLLLESLYQSHKEKNTSLRPLAKGSYLRKKLLRVLNLKQECVIEINSDRLLEVMYQSEAVQEDFNGFSAKVLDRNKLIARSLIVEHAPDILMGDAYIAKKLKAPLKVLITGDAKPLESFLLQFLKVCHFEWDEPHVIFWLDEQAVTHCEKFKRNNPSFHHFCELHPVELSLDLRQRSKLERYFEECRPDVAYVLSNSYVDLKTVIGVFGTLRFQCPTVIADLTGRLAMFNKEGVNLDTRKHESGASAHADKSRINVVEVYDSLYRNTFDEKGDLLAQLLHSGYLASKRGSVGCTSISYDDAQRAWEKLPETLKDSNRSMADHLRIKARLLQRSNIDLSDDWVAGLPKRVRESLAISEHRRWLAEKQLSGWVEGPEKSTTSRVNPSIKPWSELSTDLKTFNTQEMVQSLPEQFKLLSQLNQRGDRGVMRSDIDGELPDV